MSIPHTLPAAWPETRPGRFAETIRRESPDGCRLALLGVPDDMGVRLNHGRVGAKGGPRGFREALARYGTTFFAPEARDLANAGVFDAGDLVIADDLDTTHARLTETVGALLAQRLLPIVIGGGHDLTWPSVRAFDSARDHDFGGIYLDAHLDVREEAGSGMSFRRILRETTCAKLAVIGLDPFANSRAHVEWFTGNRGRIVPAEESLDTAWASVKTPKMFVSIDMDAIHAGAAPGVSAVNPVGLSPAFAESVAFRAGRDPRVGLIDFMEFNPVYDQDGRTGRLLARLVLSFIAGFAGRTYS